MNLFSIDNTAFEVLSYPISYIELIGTLFGLISVYFASKANILTWSTGIVNELFLFVLFYQVQLYADMTLQVYFFIITLFGWYYWKKTKSQKVISYLKPKQYLYLLLLIITCTILFGTLFANLHSISPNYFPIKAAYPYIDTFVMVLSMIATILLAKKKIENWYFWIIVDIICVIMFYKKGIVFLALEYFIFLGIVTFGYFNWKKELQHD